ncbi:MAG: Cna B-type domain-containing protein, partial [Anaerovoracaceae bacterium]
SSDVDGLLRQDHIFRFYHPNDNEALIYTDFRKIRHLAKTNGSFNISVTFTNKTTGKKYTKVMNITVRKSKPEKPELRYPTGGYIDVSKIDGTDECNLEFSSDGVNWHKPTSEDGTFYSRQWEFQVKGGFHGYVRYAASDYQEASEAAYISYWGNFAPYGDKDVKIKKEWTDGASGHRVEIVIEYDIISYVPAGKGMGIAGSSSVSKYLKSAAGNGSREEIVSTESKTIKQSERSWYIATRYKHRYTYSGYSWEYYTFHIEYHAIITDTDKDWTGTFTIPSEQKISAETGWGEYYGNIPVNIEIREINNEGYTTKISGSLDTTNSEYFEDENGNWYIIQDPGALTFINSPDTTTIDIPVSKTWSAGLVQQPVTVELYKNGEPTGMTITLSADSGWSGSFTDLRKYNNDGTKAIYAVRETSGGYDSYVTGDSSTGFTIHNSNEYTSYTVKKQWIGRPADSVKVRLYANGAEVREADLSSGNDWQYTFSSLPVLDAYGNTITYEAKEDPVEGYSSSVTQTGHEFVFTNKELTDVSVEKKWDDENDKDGMRPGSIKVQLYANGEKSGGEVTLSDENDWKYTWTDLDAADGSGNAIDYTVRETTAVDGYESSIESSGNDFIITNTHVPKTYTDKKPHSDTPHRYTKNHDTAQSTGSAGSTGPKTEDTGHVMAWAALLAASAIAAFLLRKKEER